MQKLHYMPVVLICLIVAIVCIVLGATKTGVCIAAVAIVVQHIIRRQLVANRMYRVAGMLR